MTVIQCHCERSEAISEYLDDLEDYYLAEARTRGKAKTIPLDEVERHLGLAD